MVKEGRRTWKKNYFLSLTNKLQKYDKCFIVGVDNVRSSQMQQIRAALRDRAELVMGKNTMIRRVIGSVIETNPSWEKILPFIKENVGFVFTRLDLNEIRETISKNVVAAPAKAGALAPVDVIIPKQNTGLGPEKTSFFQALSIPTKITRGTIEILNDIPIIHKNDKVGASEATLLTMLKIFPFTYGLILRNVFDEGSVYDPNVLDITPEDVLEWFTEVAARVASVSLAIEYPTVASIPHIVANSFKKLLAISVATDYTFKESEEIKHILENPEMYAAAAPVTATSNEPVPEEVAAPEADDDTDSDSDIGMGLFD